MDAVVFHEISLVAVKNLEPYEGNARTHTPEQVEQIQNSIVEFGFTNPLLITEGKKVIAGHGRLLAAINLGLKTIPCVEVEGLTEIQIKALAIADNKLALNSGWDDSLLADQLQYLRDMEYDLGIVGFGVPEIEYLLDGWDSNLEVPDGKDGTLDIVFTYKITGPQEHAEKVKEVLQNAISELSDLGVKLVG